MVCDPNTRTDSEAGSQCETISVESTTSFTRREQESVDDYLWRLLHGGRLAGLHFRRNQVVDGYVAPFYCKLPGLVIQVDEDAENEATSHKARELAFARHGLRTVHIASETVVDRPADTLQHILRAARTSPPAQITVGHHGR